MDWFWWLVDTTPFKVPTESGGWSRALTLVSVAGNLAVWLVYTIIPACLVAVVRFQNLANPKLTRLTWLFAHFIFWCGLTHLTRALTFVWPAYRLSALIVGVTALVSWVTAGTLAYSLYRWHSSRTEAAAELLERAEGMIRTAARRLWNDRVNEDPADDAGDNDRRDPA